ncbi:MAG: IclR family transcriptional regulator [Rhodospirillaceae bacterium]|nr:IclR family transcriptional regulator [Rhodospirillaceae bacterium]
MEDGSSEKGSRSVRALEIMEAIVDAGHPVSVADIMAATGLPKATAHRLCAVMEKDGYLAPDISGKGLNLGSRMRNLALGIMAMGGADAYRHQVLTDLSHEVGETCNFNIPAGNEILYVDRVETQWPLRTQLPIGSRVPLHCTASGKLYLASLSAAKRHRLLSATGLPAHTDNTITDEAAFEAEAAKIRTNKYSTDDCEFIDGMVAIAVPVNDANGRLAAILACHAPDVRMKLETAIGYLPALQTAATLLSAEISSGD